jgi:hypothetical protein
MFSAHDVNTVAMLEGWSEENGIARIPWRVFQFQTF